MLLHHAPKYLRLSWTTLITTLTFISLFFIGVLSLVVKAQRAKVKSGLDVLIGEKGNALTDISAGRPGKVFVHGEIWNAESEEEIKKDEKIEVIGVKGLKLQVKKSENTNFAT